MCGGLTGAECAAHPLLTAVSWDHGHPRPSARPPPPSGRSPATDRGQRPLDSGWGRPDIITSITARVPTYDHLNPHYQTTYPGSRTNQSGRPLACAGRPLASSGRPLASSGPPLPSSGRLLARSGRCLNIPGGHLHTSSVSITPGSRKYIHVSISATPDYAAALVAPR